MAGRMGVNIKRNCVSSCVGDLLVGCGNHVYEWEVENVQQKSVPLPSLAPSDIQSKFRLHFMIDNGKERRKNGYFQYPKDVCCFFFLVTIKSDNHVLTPSTCFRMDGASRSRERSIDRQWVGIYGWTGEKYDLNLVNLRLSLSVSIPELCFIDTNSRAAAFFPMIDEKI